MKLIGSGFLLCTGILAGCAAARRLTRRAELLRLLRQLLTAMIQELRNTLPLTADLLRMLADMPAFHSLAFLQQAAAHPDCFPQCWTDFVRADPAITPDIAAVLDTVGQTLGSTALDGQLAALQLCLERLGTLQTAAESRAAEKGSLYRSMGILCALFCVILLL